MITLEVADLVIIARHTLGLDTAGVLDLLDLAAAERALAQVQEPGDPGDLARPAAVLLCALVQGRPLRRGNQQVALAAMLQFLALNGQEMDPDPPEAVAAVVADIAAGVLGAGEVEDWLASRIPPVGRAARAKEQLMRPRPALPLAGRIRKATMRRQPTGRFQRFTDKARRAVFLATEEARLLRHPHVGTEHLLLGLVAEHEGLAAKVLESLGLSPAEVRQEVMDITGYGQHASPRHIPFTPQGKRVLELSLREALILGNNYVGTEHLLLALLRAERGIAAHVLTGLGVSHDRVLERVTELKDQHERAGHEERAGQPVPAELAETAEQLNHVRARKEAALEAEDFEAAKALRDREKELLAEKSRLERLLETAPEPPDVVRVLLAENRQLHRELDRLRGVLRDHGIEPDGGAARPA